jgi:hypothetical protein
MMAWYRLFACGEDFPVILDGNVEIVGFYTTRFVEAETQGEAEALASELLFADEDLQPPPGYEEYQPRLSFEEVEQVAAPIDIADNFSFFRMDAEDEED